jgi:hypothetical protein
VECKRRAEVVPLNSQAREALFLRENRGQTGLRKRCQTKALSYQPLLENLGLLKLDNSPVNEARRGAPCGFTGGWGTFLRPPALCLHA